MFPKCGHTFWVKCIKGYIRAMLEAEAETIPCPQANCKETITNMNVRKGILQWMHLSSF